MFERDKETPRSLACRSRSAASTRWFDDEPGYRISPDRLSPCPILASPADEAAVVGLATRVWKHARLAEGDDRRGAQADRGRWEVDGSGPRPRRAAARADQPALRRVLGRHRGPPGRGVRLPAPRLPAAPSSGTSSPGCSSGTPAVGPSWGSPHRPGRGARLPPLTRGRRDAPSDGAPASYDIPDGVDLRATTPRLAPSPAVVEATLLVRKGAGATLRRGRGEHRGRRSPGRTPTARGTAWFCGVGTVSRRSLLGLGPDVLVESPPALAQRHRGPAARARWGPTDGDASRKPAWPAPRTRWPGC